MQIRTSALVVTMVWAAGACTGAHSPPPDAGSATGGSSTGGADAGAPLAGAGGTGGGGAGGAPPRDGGGSEGVDGAPGQCPPPALPAGNRCGSAVTRSQGGAASLDDFEASSSLDTPTCRPIPAADGRKGAWTLTTDPSSPSAAYALAPPGPGGAPASTRAMHVTGNGLTGQGTTLSVSVAPCYDASQYGGLSFWIRGSRAAAPRVKVQVVTPPTAEASGGGACVPKPGEVRGECLDHFTVDAFELSDQWTRYAVTWKQLWQSGTGQLAPAGYRPETEIIALQFVPDWDDGDAISAGRSFDFWIDDVRLDVTGPFVDTGFSQIITPDKFDGTFTARRGGAPRNALYGTAYADLTAALDAPEFSRLFREGPADDRKREVAAFLAHVAQETGSLQYTVELAPPINYCDPTATLYPCAPGQAYFGRGPLQLSWNYNYGSASLFLGLGDQLLGNPASVIASGSLAWKTAIYFWLKWKDPMTGVRKIGSHFRFLREGFGATIRAINSIECGSAAAASRGNHFQAFCTAVGVGGCNQNLACPAM